MDQVLLYRNGIIKGILIQKYYTAASTCMCTHKLLPVSRSSTDSNTNIKYFRTWKWQFIVQGIESWLLPHQQISDLFQDATVPKGTWRIMEFLEMLNSHRHRENGKKEVTHVPSADYLKTAVYFWSMFQQTGKTTGWGWDGNKRGIEIWQQASCCLVWKSSQHPALHCCVRNMVKQKILESRHAWISDGAHSPQQRGRKVVWSFGWGFFGYRNC